MSRVSQLFAALCVGAAFGQMNANMGNPAVYTPSTAPKNENRALRIFETLDGRTGDPCNQFTEPAFNGAPDCNSVPDSQSTVLLPTRPVGNAGEVAHPFHTAAANRILTITGRGFTTSHVVDAAGTSSVFGTVTAPAASTHVIALSVLGRGCNDVEAADQINPVIVSDTQMTIAVPQTWTEAARELEGQPRMVCYSRNGAANSWFYTGFKIGVVWHCDHSPAVARICPPPATQVAGYSGVTAEYLKARAARTTCCRGALGLRVGQCIMDKPDSNGLNPTGPQSCCGSAAIERATERCCSTTRETTAWYSTPCPCSTRQGTAASCPTGEECCLRTKYTELTVNVAATVGANTFPADLPGECFNSNTHQCCDTGMRFDPGTHQCCTINGVQNLDVPCPCNNDFHCWGGQQSPATKNIGMRCCAQVNNTLAWEQSTTKQCSIYANYPNGTGSYQFQRCVGTCFDPTFQICCNGVNCVKEFEKCCNNTCCNRFPQTCMPARRSATPGNRWNTNDFATVFETCSTIEQMQPLKAFWSIVWPTLLLIATFFGTGLSLVFANKASSRSYASIERAMINIALLTIVMSLGIYFSPAWKYSAVVVFVQLFTILTAASRIRRLNAWCLFLQVLLALYLLDPFHGNQFLTLSSGRQTNAFADRDMAGIFHTIGKMYKNSYSADPNMVSPFCTSYYLGFFAHDNQFRDVERFDNPAKTTFGYCDRGFILILLVLSAIVLICVFLQVILTLLALLLRFTKPQVKLVVREDYDDEDYQQ
eukprot:NODE_394_length_2545_cov_460.922791_g374_i0.p1 GENE.NODE_394_length_2545_cov_460.922791_g374_i0~~NODE_394_length_2545_cov_460.922791_g374_i0.p1  ORF type:complete len:784 (-),score=272.95 NODE_394_length_2545_cov_460.922791_g374_i0:192-2486(-)